jgi:hypothetical protein
MIGVSAGFKNDSLVEAPTRSFYSGFGLVRLSRIECASSTSPFSRCDPGARRTAICKLQTVLSSLPAMNETLLAVNITAGPPAPAADTGNPFTRYNVVGMFLTLQLCQLTQPSGSLLFPGVDSFFWRCNPIASLTEALIILWHLTAALIRTARDGGFAIRKELQETASGLLLLRSAMGNDQVGGLFQKLMAGSFLDKDEVRSEPSNDSDIEDESTASATTTSHQAGTDGHPAPVLRQPTLEAQRQPQRSNKSSFDPQSEKSRILREAFGSNALAHRELRIDIITGLTEMLVMIKLLAVSGDSWFTAAGMFLIIGWTTVHLMLFLFHFKDMDEIEMTSAIRIARTLNAQLNEDSDNWMMCFIVLHLPIFSYWSYLAAFRPWFSEDAVGFIGLLKWQAMMLSVLLAIFALMIISAVFMLSLGMVFEYLLGKSTYESPRKTCSTSFALLVPGVWIYAAALSYVFQNLPEMVTASSSGFSSFFPVDTLMYQVVDMGWKHLSDGFIFLELVGAMAMGYYVVFYAERHESMPGNSFDRKRISAGNVFFTMSIFAIFLLKYDSAATDKPNWIDILG